jgi:acyl-CoA synthetase (AMP-forming)/AMP-acid ligase II
VTGDPSLTMFFDDLEQWGDRPAVVTADGGQLSYRALAQRVRAMSEGLGARRGLVLIEASNEFQPLLTYLACLQSGYPVMLVPGGRDDVDDLITTYGPSFVLAKRGEEWSLRPIRGRGTRDLHPELAVLLSTSGSTGSAKFVRLSYANLDANASSIATYLGITADDRAITSLPFHYSYGLSVVNSYLARGATILLTDRSVVDQSFWELFSAHGATSLAAVPYTFELLDRVGFDQMDLPTLRYVTAAGGRVPPETVERYARLGGSTGWDLFVMYGQSEATARMSYVPPALVDRLPGSIGRPIPGGTFELRGDDGATIAEDGRPGELVYRGPNVMMGYARSSEDLALGSQLDELATGDVAVRDADGMYAIVGRKSRFSKIFGLRIGLDELEAQLASSGHRAVCTGTDDAITIATLDRGAATEIHELVCAKTKLPAHVVLVIEYDDYPLLPSGKVDYSAIRADASMQQQAASTDSMPRPPRGSIRRAYVDVLRVDRVGPEDTFVGLGGDSLSYIQVEMALERTLGYAPRDWHRMPVGRLESMERKERRRRDVDVSVVLRAAAITLIVATHFQVFTVYGGSAVLFAVVGNNFARFQLPAIAEHDSVWPAAITLERILVPTMLYTVFITGVLGRPLLLPIVLLYSNFLDPLMNDGLSYWFIEVLAQITFFVTVLLAIPRIRHSTARRPRLAGAMLLAGAVVLRVGGPVVWDTDHLAHRVPHMMLWLFALGWCIHFSKSTTDRVIMTLLAAALLPGAFGEPTETVVFATGIVLLIWVERVPVVAGLDRVLGALATASLYIYLTHFQFQTVLEKFGIDYPVLTTVTGLGGGVAIWVLSERAIRASRPANPDRRAPDPVLLAGAGPDDRVPVSSR